MGAPATNIAHFRTRYPDRPLTNLFRLLQDGESQPDKVSTLKSMAAGMVVLLAHMNVLSHDDAIQIQLEIAAIAITAANDPAPGSAR